MAIPLGNRTERDAGLTGQPVARSVESRRTERVAMTAPVRLGWIDDEKRMAYVTGRCVDRSASGLGVWTSERPRLSALVHLEVAERDMVAVGRVRNCIRSCGGWRAGIELMPMALGQNL